jgi:hypothetical protein
LKDPLRIDRSVREGGRRSRGRLKAPEMVKDKRVVGRESRGWLKSWPRERWERRGKRERSERGSLNEHLNITEEAERGIEFLEKIYTFCGATVFTVKF